MRYSGVGWFLELTDKGLVRKDNTQDITVPNITG